MSDKHTMPSLERASVTFLALLIVTAISFGLLIFLPGKKVNNFEECISAGGARLESYPEQCLYKKKTYVNEAQLSPNENDYIGMEENNALMKAKDSNTPARVVERDGEGLPTTMDFVSGRHNFYVKNGAVYKVEIEGQATDGSGSSE